MKHSEKLGGLLVMLVLCCFLLGSVLARAQNSRIGSGPQGVTTIFNNQICSEPTFLSGQVWCAGGPLVIFPAQTAITSVTTAQTAATFTPWTGFLNNYLKTLRVKVWGVYTQPSQSTGQNVAVSLQYGSTTLATATSAATSTSACTNCQFQAEFWVTTTTKDTTGGGGAVEAHGALGINLGAATTTAESWFQDTNTSTVSSLNLTTSNALNVNVAASGGTNALGSVTVRGASVEISN